MKADGSLFVAAESFGEDVRDGDGLAFLPGERRNIVGVECDGGAEELPADIHDALREIGVRKMSSALDGGVLRIRCQVTDFDALSRKAGVLGDGKVRVARNTLS